MKNKEKLFGGTYCFGGTETHNLVSPVFEKEILKAMFQDNREITQVTVKLGQIGGAFDRATELSDITESSNYTPVVLSLPSASDWEVINDESLAFSVKTRQLTFNVSGGDCSYNCYYIVDQTGRLLSVSAKLASVVTKTSAFTGYYKFYCL